MHGYLDKQTYPWNSKSLLTDMSELAATPQLTHEHELNLDILPVIFQGLWEIVFIKGR